MAIRDQSTAEKRSILAFVRTQLEKRSLNLALAMVKNPKTKPADIRALAFHYRDR